MVLLDLSRNFHSGNTTRPSGDEWRTVDHPEFFRRAKMCQSFLDECQWLSRLYTWSAKTTDLDQWYCFARLCSATHNSLMALPPLISLISLRRTHRACI